MRDNLDLLKISLNVLKKFENRYDNNMLLSVACNYKNVNDNLAYLKSKNIEDAEELFLHRPEVFIYEKNKFINGINSFDISLFNEDICYIDDVKF